MKELLTIIVEDSVVDIFSFKVITNVDLRLVPLYVHAISGREAINVDNYANDLHLRVLRELTRKKKNSFIRY